MSKSVFTKFAGLKAFIKKDFRHRCSPVNSAKLLKILLIKEDLWTSAFNKCENFWKIPKLWIRSFSIVVAAIVPQFPADLVTFPEEILNGKLRLLSSDFFKLVQKEYEPSNFRFLGKPNNILNHEVLST